MNKNEFNEFIDKTKEELVVKLHHGDWLYDHFGGLRFDSICFAASRASDYFTKIDFMKRLRKYTHKSRGNSDAYWFGEVNDENTLVRMMVLECVREEMLKDKSYKEL
jgi:hypothetical protein